MAEFKIEKGIPVPPLGAATGATAVIRQLKVGESVLLSCSVQGANNLVRQARRSDDMRDREFTCRTIKGEGTRVWRIK